MLRLPMKILALCCASVALQGCISTAVGVVTAPVRAVGQVVDWTTTSQSESDRNRGRAVREREEEIGRLDRRRARAASRCDRGDADACEQARRLQEEVETLRDRPLPR